MSEIYTQMLRPQGAWQALYWLATNIQHPSKSERGKINFSTFELDCPTLLWVNCFVGMKIILPLVRKTVFNVYFCFYSKGANPFFSRASSLTDGYFKGQEHVGQPPEQTSKHRAAHTDPHFFVVWGGRRTAVLGWFFFFFFMIQKNSSPHWSGRQKTDHMLLGSKADIWPVRFSVHRTYVTPKGPFQSLF